MNLFTDDFLAATGGYWPNASQNNYLYGNRQLGASPVFFDDRQNPVAPSGATPLTSNSSPSLNSNPNH